MFRDCYFEYAGVYSGDYNLVLIYADNSYEEFDTGGAYEASVDTLPMSTENLLYGLKHSENPLEFSVEIINPDGAIPFKQMVEIKNWLFGQTGWKKLYLKDKDFSPYHLKCLLIPDQDIVDASGYRGLRCIIKNISPFWYGDEVDINFDSESLTVDRTTLDDNNGYIQLKASVEAPSELIKVYPTISFNYRSSGLPGSLFLLHNDTNGSAVASKEYQFQVGSTTFDTKYLDAKFCPIADRNIFYLSRGTNNLRFYSIDKVDNPVKYNSLTFSYEPMYRIGGF